MATDIREAQECIEVACQAQWNSHYIFESHECGEWASQPVNVVYEAHEVIEVAMSNVPYYYTDSAVPRSIGSFTQ